MVRFGVFKGLPVALLIIGLMSSTGCAAGGNIGIVDVQKIMKRSEAAKEARNVFITDLESKRTVLRAKQAEVRKMEQQLRSSGAAKDSDEFKRQQELLAQEVKTLRRLKTDLEEELKKTDLGLTQQIFEELRVILESYRKKKKLSAIFDKKTVLVFDDAVDITEDIITIYDKQTNK
jgi:Skp family chaperone for outer membrane proteins